MVTPMQRMECGFFNVYLLLILRIILLTTSESNF